MKRIIMLAMVLVMLFVSSGCWVGWTDEGGRGGRSGGHNSGDKHDSGDRHDSDNKHDNDNNH
jgi:hypothetical protein